jgi:hypothetical protein
MSKQNFKPYFLEWLSLRSTPDQCPTWYETLNRLRETMDPGKSLQDATTYINAAIPGDTSLLLHWNGTPEAAGSALAEGMKHQLRRHGLVDHSVWVPQLKIYLRTQLTAEEESP